MLVDANLLSYAALEEFPPARACARVAGYRVERAETRRLALVRFARLRAHHDEFPSVRCSVEHGGGLAAGPRLVVLPLRLDTGAGGAPCGDPGRPAGGVQGDGQPRAGRTPGRAGLGALPDPLQHGSGLRGIHGPVVGRSARLRRGDRWGGAPGPARCGAVAEGMPVLSTFNGLTGVAQWRLATPGRPSPARMRAIAAIHAACDIPAASCRSAAGRRW